MNERDRQEIAALFEDVLSRHSPKCPNGIDAETAATLKAFAEAVRVGKKSLVRTVVGAVATAILGLIVLGLVEFFKKN